MRERFSYVCFRVAAYTLDIVLLGILQVCIEILNTLIYIQVSDDSEEYVWILTGMNGSISICMFWIFFMVLPTKFQGTIGQKCVSFFTKRKLIRNLQGKNEFIQV